MRFNKYLDQEFPYSEDPVDRINCDLLGFCGCGFPDDVLFYIKHILGIVKTGDYLKTPKQDTGQIYFAFYVLTVKGFLEHGSSVPGWLTAKGEDLLADLQELFTEVPK